MNANQTLVCHKCGYDANPNTATHCEICNYPLKHSTAVRLDNSLGKRRSGFFGKWVVSILLLVLAAGGSYTIWRSQTSNTQDAQLSENVPNPARSLRILGNSFSGYSTFRKVAFQKALKEVDIDLHYQDAEKMNPAQLGELLNQGKADLMLVTLDEFLGSKVQGKVVGLIDRTAGGDAVVLNTKKYPNLTSLQALTELVQRSRSLGQQLGIAFSGDSPSEYLALLLSARFEAFELSDFQIYKVVDAVDALRLLQDPKQNVAVAVLWEPYITQAQKQGYTVVLSSKDTPGAIVDVVVASDRLIQTQPEKISAFLQSYYRQIDATIADASQFRNQIAEDGKLSPSDATAVMEGIEFFTAIEAKKWMTDNTLEKRIGSTSAILTLAGRIDQVSQTPKDLFTSQFIAQAASNTQNLINLVRTDNPQLANKLIGKAVTTSPKVKASQVKNASSIGNLRPQGNVSFKSNSAQLTAEGKQTLNKLAEEIAEFNAQTVAVRVIGHTSKSGVADFNQILSQQRANAVAEYLRSRGLQQNIFPQGKGFSELLPGISPDDRRNQRTEIRLIRLN